MANETQTAIGNCPTHGEVEGTRQIPKISFPPIISVARRTVALRSRPYRCPTCGAQVTTD